MLLPPREAPSILAPAPPRPAPGRARRRCRAIWISDVHLGTKACRAAELASFLAAHHCDRLYLVGDLLDGWMLGRGWTWTPAQTDVVRGLLAKVHDGCDVVYLPGNHDEALRDHVGLVLAGVRVASELVHEGADGRRYLVLHGDRFDAVVTCHRRLAVLGDHAHRAMLVVDRWLDVARRRLGYPYWSLSGWLKRRVKDAVSYVSEFERAIAEEARRRGVDGVICGHVHEAELREIDGVLYANDGDWVESCTALVERFDGALELVRWAGEDGTLLRQGRGELLATA